ncbi:MAG: phosphatidate cytidylyltransferase [Treponema sp.]|nr:phosphatidate cytidylyltransferase [Treponema sp.]
MRNLIERLLVFFVGFPLVLSTVVFFSFNNHLILNIIILSFTIAGALEFRNILKQKNLVISSADSIILGGISPVACVLIVSFGVNPAILPVVFILGALWLLVSNVFSGQDKLDTFINRAAAGLAIMIYPGLFITWFIRMALFPGPEMVILVFLLIVLLNDAFAWAAGMLFGKNNKGLVKASPGKSIAGFLGGMLASILCGILATILIPDAFTSRIMSSAIAGAILGLTAGAAATLGDLCESAIKRSAGVKDSGKFLLGRGGALDSIDSIIIAAPVYYILFRALFT